jgi:hypothetical protein
MILLESLQGTFHTKGFRITKNNKEIHIPTKSEAISIISHSYSMHESLAWAKKGFQPGEPVAITLRQGRFGCNK